MKTLLIPIGCNPYYPDNIGGWTIDIIPVHYRYKSKTQRVLEAMIFVFQALIVIEDIIYQQSEINSITTPNP